MLAAVLHLLLNSCILSYVLAQPGFLTLDCGATDPYIDDNGVSWTPDDAYITTGKSASISRATSSRYLQRLRYFPDATRKHCYALPAGFDGTYIIRAWFYYGNYDNLGSSLIEFDVFIGATKFDRVQFNGDHESYNEYVIKSTNEDYQIVDLCLATSSTSARATAPFVSAIEMRLLQSGMYGLTSSTQGLFLTRRIDLGASSKSDIRYPEDKYDRIWSSDKMFLGMRNYTSVSTTSIVSPGTTRNQPPSAVMSTAITSNSTIIFEFPDDTIFSEYCHFIFYFAEFTILGANTREFNFLLTNGFPQQTSPFFEYPINILKIASSPLTSMELESHSEPTYLSSPTFNLVPTNISTLGPLLNAAEIFRVMNLNLGTEDDDMDAITELLSHFNISGWSGDPCLPLPYTWNWISCDTTGPVAKITMINLSDHQLRGTIPHVITHLEHLTKIYLENNHLEGAIPDLTSLTNLTVLHLQNNNLNGSFPSSLLDMSSLEDLSVQNNSFDCIPQKLATSFNGLVSICDSTSSTSIWKIVGGALVGVVALLLVMMLLSVWLCRRKRRPKSEEANNRPHENLSIASESSKSRLTFSYDEIDQATHSFEKVLGEGSFGPVYYGRLSNGVEVAVKILASGSQQGEREFNSEVEVLSFVHHKNLVSFLGSCKEGPKLMLVYEYLPNGTLRDHLYGGKKPTLSWKTRLEILLDAAEGLDYLHTSCNQRIIHRDVKTTNILLDSAMKAKVADFGISKLYDICATHVSTVVKGTPGYMCPEYHIYGRLTDKSDVYSFGVVIFEVACGREPLCPMLPEEEVVLTRWATNELNKGDLAIVIDPKLSTEMYYEQAAWKLLELAMQCVEIDSTVRPSMRTVVSEIMEAINLEEKGVSNNSISMFTRAR